MRASPITPTVDLAAEGEQHGFLKLPYLTRRFGVGRHHDSDYRDPARGGADGAADRRQSWR